MKIEGECKDGILIWHEMQRDFMGNKHEFFLNLFRSLNQCILAQPPNGKSAINSRD